LASSSAKPVIVVTGTSGAGKGTLFTDPAAPVRVREELRAAAEGLGLVDPWEAVGIAHEATVSNQATRKIPAFQAN